MQPIVTSLTTNYPPAFAKNLMARSAQISSFALGTWDIMQSYKYSEIAAASTYMAAKQLGIISNKDTLKRATEVILNETGAQEK